MPDPTRKLRRGERITVEAFNTTVDAARVVKERLQRTGANPQPVFKQSGIVLVRNDTGSAMGRFSVLGIDLPIIEPAANLDEFKRQVTFECTAPVTADDSRFVILQEPLAAGAIGRAVLAGVTWVKVLVNDSTEATYKRAKIINADTTRLGMSTTGPAEVLWKESGTGEKWACVRLGMAGLSLGDPADFGTNYVLYWNASTDSIEWYPAASLGGTTFSGARVWNNGSISISNATTTYLTFDTERFDTDNYHSTVSNTGRLTVPSTAKYQIGANVRFDSNSVGLRSAHIRVNGTTTIALDERIAEFSGAHNSAINLSALWSLSASDYAELGVYQTSGASLNLTNTPAYASEFWIHKVG